MTSQDLGIISQKSPVAQLDILSTSGLSQIGNNNSHNQNNNNLLQSNNSLHLRKDDSNVSATTIDLNGLIEIPSIKTKNKSSEYY